MSGKEKIELKVSQIAIPLKYHSGASLKDLGKKWFAFSKFDKDAFTLLERLAGVVSE